MCCCGSSFASLNPGATVYVVQQSVTEPDKLIVHVDRSRKPSATWLVLPNILSGTTNQVKKVSCNNQIITESKPRVWFIPKNCQKLSWQIALHKHRAELAAEQQSIRSGNFTLLSSVSSLPLLQDDVGPAFLQIAIFGTKTIFPQLNSAGLIPLPKFSAAPLFVLLNATQVDAISLGSIKLTYLLDNAKLVSALPSMTNHLNGLRWLNTIIPSKSSNFVTVWIGVPREKMSPSGAAGGDVLLTNYPQDGKIAFGNAILLYVALHEAFHQFATGYAKQPGWVIESLASYYGIRSTKVALPNEPKVSLLMKRFQEVGKRYSAGLLAIDRQVAKGNRSGYEAFYTKGLAFWAAVDKVLQGQGDSLDHHLIAVFNTKYDKHGNPINLQKNLTLNAKAWALLQRNFLDGLPKKNHRGKIKNFRVLKKHHAHFSRT